MDTHAKMNRQTRDELHTLIAALIDGSITESEQARLGSVLERHADARKVYLDYCDIHADLALEAGHVGDVAWPIDVRGDRAVVGRVTPSPMRWGLWGTVAALLAVIAAMWVSMQNQPIDRPAFVATIVETQGATWTTNTPVVEDAVALGVGRRVATGTIRVDDGKTRFDMLSGASLTLIGPAEVELVDAKAVRLVRGDISVDVPESAIGFRVVTPTADVVDLGTEFGISVDDSGTTEVHVFDGIVAARSLDGSAVVPIVGREAGRVDTQRGDFVSVAFDAKRFGRDSNATGATRKIWRDANAADHMPIKPGARIVFLGDKMTSRETHLLLINQALRHLPDADAPKLYNAGIGFRLWFDEPEFQKYVKRYKPDYAVLEFGADLAKWTEPPHTPKEIEDAITRLCDRLDKAGVTPIITTSYPLEEQSAEFQPRLDSFNDVMRDIAKRRGYRLADVDAVFRAGGRTGWNFVFNKRDLPTFEGYRLIASSLLETWGYTGVEVPNTLDLQMLPGVVTDWAINHMPRSDTLDSATVASLQPDETWEHITLPRVDKFNKRLADPTHSWTYQDQVRGYATHLPYRKGKKFVAVTTVESDTDRDAYINTGSGIQSVWINGEKVYTRGPWLGGYPGSDRTAVTLRKGLNRIVIETPHSFFFSITDTVDWPLPR